MYYLIFTLIVSSVFLLSASAMGFGKRQFYLISESEISLSGKKQQFVLPEKLDGLLAFISRPFSGMPYFKKLQLQLETLRINVNLSVWILLKIFLAILIGTTAFFLLSPFYSLIAILIGFFIPDFILVAKIKTKKQAIIRCFPETVDLLELFIGAGLDFVSAISWLIKKTEVNPFIEQLEIVLKEIQVGRMRPEALKNMSLRLQLADINSFVRTLIQAERMGTSIEETFSNLSEDTRLRRFQAGERQAIQASLWILLPLLFCILPVILIVVAGPVILRFTEGNLLGGGM
jgi:pilus assembly protein TadC